MQAVLEHVGVTPLDELLVFLVDRKHLKLVVLACRQSQQRQVRVAGTAVGDADQCRDVPRLRVQQVHSIGAPHPDERHFGWVEAGHPLEASAANLLALQPVHVGDLLTLPVDQVELLLVVLEGNDFLASDQQVVDHFTCEVTLTAQVHCKGVLVDVEESDAVVGTDHKLVDGLINHVWQHDQFVDHAQLVEEAV